MKGYCSECGRGLGNLRVDGRGDCREHGLVNANWTDPRVVVDDRTGLVLGLYRGTDTDTQDVAYTAPDGSVSYAPALYADVLRSSEIEGGEW